MVTPENFADRLKNLSQLIRTDPEAAAGQLEESADRMLKLAARLRELAAQGPYRSRGGTADRVQMEVVGPDGNVKQSVDTAAPGPIAP
jgi:hypothetical protein